MGKVAHATGTFDVFSEGSLSSTVDTTLSDRRLSPMQKPFDRSYLVRAIVAGTVGSSIEFYDFVLSATAAILIFPKVFFPHTDPLAGTLIAFSTYSAGFVTRPIGAAFFGHFGDRLGRKSTLVATLVTMGLVSVGIGLLPGYAQIGIWGGILLTGLRLLQGFAIGGEWGGTILLPIEWGPPNRRGFIGAWPHLGFPSGLLTSNLALIIVGALVGPRAFAEWGWRIPFLLGGVLILFGFYVRLGVLETPPFTRMLEERRIVRWPVVEVLRRNWREVVLGALALQPVLVAFYLWATFALSYGTRTLKLGQDLMLVTTLSAAAVALVGVITFGALSDRFGYKRTYVTGLIAYALLAFPYYWLFDTRQPVLVVVASVAGLITFALLYGPLAAFVSSLYSGQVRYTGVSLSYHLAAAIGGGPAPIIAGTLLAATKSSAAIAGYLVVSALVALAATRLLRDRSQLDHRVDLDARARPAKLTPGPARPPHRNGAAPALPPARPLALPPASLPVAPRPLPLQVPVPAEEPTRKLPASRRRGRRL
jgi:MFS family permease